MEQKIPKTLSDGSVKVMSVTESWCVLSVTKEPDGQFGAVSTFLDSEFRVTDKHVTFFSKRTDAERACCKKLRVKKKHYYQETNDFPEEILPYLKVEVDNQISNKEALALIDEARRERYVVFKDCTGIEDCFDEGVEWIGYIDPNDDAFMEVMDRYGELRTVSIERLSSIDFTERTREVFR
jgi:predicted DNA-binding WGR domain protein